MARFKTKNILKFQSRISPVAYKQTNARKNARTHARTKEHLLDSDNTAAGDFLFVCIDVNVSARGVPYGVNIAAAPTNHTTDHRRRYRHFLGPTGGGVRTLGLETDRQTDRQTGGTVKSYYPSSPLPNSLFTVISSTVISYRIPLTEFTS